MEITEIRIKLMEASEDRLRGFCSITIENAFVIRDLKIIDGSNGPFVAMPSRKLSSNCQRCRHKNHLRSNYCNHCGTKLQHDEAGYATPQKLYADVAHPINSECREEIQQAVLAELETELARCEQPGYRSRYDDEFDAEGNPTPPPARSRQASETHAPETKNTTRKTDNTITNQNSSERIEPENNSAVKTPAMQAPAQQSSADHADNPASLPAHSDSKHPAPEHPTTSRIDSQPTDAVPAPMSLRDTSLRDTETTKRSPAANSSPDEDDSFGAGIF